VLITRPESASGRVPKSQDFFVIGILKFYFFILFYSFIFNEPKLQNFFSNTEFPNWISNKFCDFSCSKVLVLENILGKTNSKKSKAGKYMSED